MILEKIDSCWDVSNSMFQAFDNEDNLDVLYFSLL